MTSSQKHLNFDDVITTNFNTLFLISLDLLRTENLGITFSHRIFSKSVVILPFQKLKFVTRHTHGRCKTGGKNIRCRIEKFYALNKKLINFIF